MPPGKLVLDGGFAEPRAPRPRRSARTPLLSAEVFLRRSAQLGYRVQVFDASRLGCRVQFVERPKLDERVWVKFDGLEALEADVCWVEGFDAGLELIRPIHPAVFDLLVNRLNDFPPTDSKLTR